MGGGKTRGKSEITAEWVIRDKEGNIKEQGTDLPTQKEEGQGKENKE